MQMTKDELREILNGTKPLQLAGYDLSKADLNQVDLSKADLSGADLNGAFLDKARLRYANLSNANLEGADLSEANFHGFLTRLPVTTRWTFVSAGSLYVAGALGIEMLEARYHYVSHTWTDLSYALLVGVEEPLEMTGIALFIYGISTYLARSGGTLSIRFVEDSARSCPLSSIPAVHTVRDTDRFAA